MTKGHTVGNRCLANEGPTTLDRWIVDLAAGKIRETRLDDHPAGVPASTTGCWDISTGTAMRCRRRLPEAMPPTRY